MAQRKFVFFSDSNVCLPSLVHLQRSFSSKEMNISCTLLFCFLWSSTKDL